MMSLPWKYRVLEPVKLSENYVVTGEKIMRFTVRLFALVL